MADIVKQVSENTGFNEEEIIERLSSLLTFANPTEDDYEKEGVEALGDLGVIDSDHDGREPLSFGQFGTILGRYHEKYLG